MKLVHDNSSIECLAANVISRKIIASSYMKINKIGKCFVFKCSRNSEAWITKELNPKEPLYNEISALNLNDYLEAENITVAIDSRRMPKISLTKHSGRHKAQTCETANYTYAVITRQIHSTPLAIPPVTIIPIDKE